jgi:FK506-binding protein 4/5
LVFEVELLDWKSVKDISGDGGVIKTTINEGTGWDQPKDDDEVKIRLAAKVLDAAASPVFETPEGGAEFTLKDGYFCKGVGVAVKRMKKGEEARVILKPEYAFGEQGKEDINVPPGASLELTLSLVGWNKVEKVTPDGGVIKKTLEATEEWQRPNAGATVTVAYVAKLEDGTVFEDRTESSPLSFVTEEDQAPCEGFELAVMQVRLCFYACFLRTAPVLEKNVDFSFLFFPSCALLLLHPIN